MSQPASSIAAPARAPAARSASTAVVASAPSLSPSAARSPGTACGLATPHLRGPQDRQDQVDPRLTRRRLPEHVQTVADLGVLDLAEPAVDVEDEVVEVVVLGALVEAEVAMHLGGVHQLPDLAADGGQLGRVHRRDVAVLIEELLQPRDVAVRLGPRHRRHQVVDDRRVRAPLGLRALAGVVDEERVDQRQVADRRVGGTRRPTARRSCRAATPSSRACRGGRRHGRRSPPPAIGTPPGSGGSVRGRGRGRSRPGSRRIRAGAGSAAPRCRPGSWRARSRPRR